MHLIIPVLTIESQYLINVIKVHSRVSSDRRAEDHDSANRGHVRRNVSASTTGYSELPENIFLTNRR